jgi:hypothetical protein
VAGAKAKSAFCLFFGACFGWYIGYITFGILGFLMGFALWAAGREMGSQMRRGHKELGLQVMLPFLVGMTLGTSGFAFAISSLLAFVPWAMNIGLVAFGYFLGRCGFG